MKIRIARFHFVKSDIYTIQPESHERYTDAVRVSDYVTVDFPDRPTAEVVEGRVAEIDKKIGMLEQEVARLRAQKTDALSLVFQSEETA